MRVTADEFRRLVAAPTTPRYPRPLSRVGPSWQSKDGHWLFGRMEATGDWFVWERGDEYPHTSDRFGTLSDAVEYVRSWLGREEVAALSGPSPSRDAAPDPDADLRPELPRSSSVRSPK